MKKIQILTLNAYTVQGCTLETGAAKSGPRVQNDTSVLYEECSGTDGLENVSLLFLQH